MTASPKQLRFGIQTATDKAQVIALESLGAEYTFGDIDARSNREVVYR